LDLLDVLPRLHSQSQGEEEEQGYLAQFCCFHVSLLSKAYHLLMDGKSYLIPLPQTQPPPFFPSIKPLRQEGGIQR
jgi:hypothetical protein